MKLLGLSKVASQYIGEIMGGGQYSQNHLLLAICFNINMKDLTAKNFIDFSVRAALAFIVLWSFNIFKKAVRRR